jgi:hypothetical protein
MAADGSGGTRCPSAPATLGATVIGMIGEDGRIANFATPLVADAHFLEAVRTDNERPEKKFRFSSTCAENKCAQWNGSGCGLIDRITTQIAEAGLSKNTETPPCVIRAECRWFMQNAYEACRVCSYVVTDTRER